VVNLREQLVLAAPQVLAWGGLAIGVVFGVLLERTRFCAMGALSDLVAFGDRRRLRAWLLASAVAIIGAQSLQAAAVVDLGLSMYLAPSLNWLGNILGGLMFGIGMVFAGGCASRNLVRLGGGDLRAVVVLVVMGVCAYMTLGGILGPLRVALENMSAIGTQQSLAAWLAGASGLSMLTARWLVTAVLAGGLLIYCWRDAAFRRAPALWAGGIGVGLCVVAAWAVSGLAYDEFAVLPQAPQALSFVRPSGDTLEYLQRYTANAVPGFGVATVLGTVLGASLAALSAGRFKLVGFADSADTLRNLSGAALMGVGGVVAMGCSIGQSLSGVSTLAVGSLLAALALIAGGVLGLRILERSLQA
jgi:uncharacterized protein